MRTGNNTKGKKMETMKFYYAGMLRVLDKKTVRVFHSQSTDTFIVNGFDVMRQGYRSFFQREMKTEDNTPLRVEHA